MTGLAWFSHDLTDLVHPIVSGRVYGVIAPTGAGKTLFDLNLVAHLLQEDGGQVLVAATEETPRYVDLLACRAALVSYADFFYGRLTDDEQGAVARWRVFYERHERLHVLPAREPTLGNIVEAMQRGDDIPDVLLIDHLHCLEREGRRFPEFIDVAMSVLPELASTLDIAVILLAQVHRPQLRDPLYAYRIPTPTSGLGSPKIEQNSDVLLGLSRKLRDDIPKDALARLAKGLLRRGESVRDYEEPNTARITVLKHRMDDEASRRSILLTVRHGKMQDRLCLAEGTTGQPIDEDDDAPPF